MDGFFQNFANDNQAAPQPQQNQGQGGFPTNQSPTQGQQGGQQVHNVGFAQAGGYGQSGFGVGQTQPVGGGAENALSQGITQSGGTPPQFQFGQGMNWSNVSDNAKHPFLGWGSGNRQNGKPYEIQPGEELVLSVQRGFCLTSTGYKNKGIYRKLILTVQIGQAKINQSLVGQTVNLDFKAGYRRDLLAAEVAPGDMVGLLYEGMRQLDGGNTKHVLHIRVAKNPQPKAPITDPMGIEVTEQQLYAAQGQQQGGFQQPQHGFTQSPPLQQTQGQQTFPGFPNG